MNTQRNLDALRAAHRVCELLCVADNKTSVFNVEPVLNKEDFTNRVLQKMSEQGECASYMDSIISVCNDLQIEPEESKAYMSEALKNNLFSEAQAANLLQSKMTTNQLF